MASSNRQRWSITVVGLLLALGLPFAHLGDLGRRFSGLGSLVGGDILWWALFVVVLLYVSLVERRPLSSIGYRSPGIKNIVFGLLGAVVAFIGTGVIFQMLLPALHININGQLSTVATMPLWFRVLLVTRAAVVEETLFRGYGLERTAELTGSTWIAGLITWALFTMAHLSSWGWGQVIIAAFGGLVLTLLYLWRRNIWANILTHWLTDGAAFILLPLLGAHGKG